MVELYFNWAFKFNPLIAQRCQDEYPWCKRVSLRKCSLESIGEKCKFTCSKCQEDFSKPQSHHGYRNINDNRKETGGKIAFSQQSFLTIIIKVKKYSFLNYKTN